MRVFGTENACPAAIIAPALVPDQCLTMQQSATAAAAPARYVMAAPPPPTEQLTTSGSAGDLFMAPRLPCQSCGPQFAFACFSRTDGQAGSSCSIPISSQWTASWTTTRQVSAPSITTILPLWPAARPENGVHPSSAFGVLVKPQSQAPSTRGRHRTCALLRRFDISLNTSVAEDRPVNTCSSAPGQSICWSRHAGWVNAQLNSSQALNKCRFILHLELTLITDRSFNHRICGMKL